LMVWLIVTAAVAVTSLFNYFLNRAPGSDPEDFLLGPQELGMSCDCFLNTLVVGSVVVVAIAAGAGAFATRNELFIAGALAFVIVTLAGILGRRRRHKEWDETHKAIRRAVPPSVVDPYQRSSIHLLFDEDEHEDEEYDPEEP
jgi:hypothetical protein